MSRLHLVIAAVVGLTFVPLAGLAQVSGDDAATQSVNASSPASIDSIGSGASINMQGLEPLWAKGYPLSDSREDRGLAISGSWEVSGTSGKKYEYVLGTRSNRSGDTDVLVLKLDAAGEPVSSFGYLGVKQVPLPSEWYGTWNAAFGERTANGSYKRVYFAGSMVQSGSTDEDMAILCVDLTTANAACSGWPTGSLQVIKIDLGGTNRDRAHVITFDPDGYLFVGGVAGVSVYNPPVNRVVAVLVKMYASNGAVVSAFGDNQKGWQTYPAPGGLGEYSVDVASIALASADTPGGKRVYFGGSKFVNLDGSWTYGYVLSVDPENATSKFKLVGAHSTPVVETTEVTALTVLRNGKVAFAGWTNTDSADSPGMLMGRLNAGPLDYDPSFCGGKWDCVITAANGSPGWMWKQRVRPAAIAERPGNRDLVISLNNNFYSLIDGTATPSQTVQEWNRNGTIQYDEMNNNYSASDGTATAAYSAGVDVDDEQTLFTGYQYWGGTIFHVTAARHMNNDYIFADSFGGSHND